MKKLNGKKKSKGTRKKKLNKKQKFLAERICQNLDYCAAELLLTYEEIIDTLDQVKERLKEAVQEKLAEQK